MGVFARRGLGLGRPAEVAAAAGVAESTVFVYFPTRQDLVRAVVGESERLYLEMDRAILEKSGLPASEAVSKLARSFADSVDSHPHHARVFLDWSNAVGDEIFPRYLAFQEAVIQMLTATLQRGLAEGCVAEDVNPDDAARLIFSAAQMVVQMKLTGQHSARIDRFLRSVTRAGIGQPLPDQA
jgi:AcrR family transcriptional regulator